MNLDLQDYLVLGIIIAVAVSIFIKLVSKK